MSRQYSKTIVIQLIECYYLCMALDVCIVNNKLIVKSLQISYFNNFDFAV